MANNYLVFDIETAGKDLDAFEPSQQEYLLRHANTEEEREQKIREFALSPFTSEIVCIGMALMGPDGSGWRTEKEGALALDPAKADEEEVSEQLESGAVMVLSNERTMLVNFWKMLQRYRNAHLISFNGRGFDAPYMMLRSALHKVRPSRNLMDGTKWRYPLHTDLADELSYFSFQSSGPQRRFNFDFYARSFGITSPKAEGVDGSMVSHMYREGRLREIAEYCMRDVRATWELYNVWEKYLHLS